MHDSSVSCIQPGSNAQKEAAITFVAPSNLFAVTIDNEQPLGVTEFSMAMCSVSEVCVILGGFPQKRRTSSPNKSNKAEVI